MTGLGPGSRLAIALTVAVLGGCSQADRAASAPLTLERTIPLPRVSGRIDHLAFDGAHRRLFVAALGNGSLEAVDLDTDRARRIEGLKEPQGVAYIAEKDLLIVACGGDGSVRFYQGETLAPLGAIALGEDADNVRVDPATGDVVVGYSKGALAIVDPARRIVRRTIALPAHPEGFQIDGARRRAYVNLPGARAIAEVDLDAGTVRRSWPAAHQYNFPLALDADAGELATVFRLPARFVLIDPASGKTRQDLPTCGDADDVFFDVAHHRLYVVCGSGHVEVFNRSQDGYTASGRIDTRSGARTGLFVPALDRLVVAARAGLIGSEAALLVLRPAP